jgi:hypothetical protein
LAEEYQRREAAFNETIAAYQRQAGIPGDAAYRAELEERVVGYRRLLDDAGERIRILEARLSEAERATQNSYAAPSAPGEEDMVRRVRELKAQAERLRDSLMP